MLSEKLTRIKLLFLGAFLVLTLTIAVGFVFPQKALAQPNLSQINQQLASILSVLSKLSADLDSGSISLEAAGSELERLSVVVNAYVTLAQASMPVATLDYYDPPPGQVLGAFTQTSEQFFQYPPQPPEAFISINPGTSNWLAIVTKSFASDVLNFSIKSLYSDIEIRRVDVTFDKRMWIYAEEISLVSGGRVLSRIVQPMSPSNFFQDGADRYLVRFTDFSETVPKDQTRILSVRIKSREFVPEEAIVRVFLANGAIRAVDQIGLQHTLPSTSGGISGSFSREFRITR